MRKLLAALMLLLVLVMPVLAAETGATTQPTETEEWVEPEEPIPAETEAETLETYRLAINVMFKPEAAYEDYEEVSFRVYDEDMQKYLVCEYSDNDSGYVIHGFAGAEEKATLLTPKNGVIMFARLPYGTYTFENVSVPEDFTLVKEKFSVCISDGEATLQMESSDEATEFSIADDGFMSVTAVITEQVDLPSCHNWRCSFSWKLRQWCDQLPEQYSDLFYEIIFNTVDFMVCVVPLAIMIFCIIKLRKLLKKSKQEKDTA